MWSSYALQQMKTWPHKATLKEFRLWPEHDILFYLNYVFLVYSETCL